MITVFTPTYNRKKELTRLYQSLLEQDFKDFEWLVVDDGSTDETEEMIHKFIAENKIKINYYKQENRGKSFAHNKGVELAKGEFFVGVDSDDMLVKNSLKLIYTYFDKIKNNNNIGGISFLDCRQGSNEIIGSKFPQNEMVDTYHNLYNKHKVTGDKKMVFKTSVLREFFFPVYENEKFVPEALLFNRICKKYKLLCVNEPVIQVEYLADGYSANYFELAKKNPRAQMQYYKELWDLDKSNYNIAAFDLYAIYAKYGIIKAIKDHPAKFRALIMFIPAYIKYWQKELKK